jgi:hypothetical protein
MDAASSLRAPQPPNAVSNPLYSLGIGRRFRLRQVRASLCGHPTNPHKIESFRCLLVKSRLRSSDGLLHSITLEMRTPFHRTTYRTNQMAWLDGSAYEGLLGIINFTKSGVMTTGEARAGGSMGRTSVFAEMAFTIQLNARQL